VEGVVFGLGGGGVPPSGGSLEIGNVITLFRIIVTFLGSPFGGIPRNWKLPVLALAVLSAIFEGSPFGGIPRNWKPHQVYAL